MCNVPTDALTACFDNIEKARLAGVPAEALLVFSPTTGEEFPAYLLADYLPIMYLAPNVPLPGADGEPLYLGFSSSEVVIVDITDELDVLAEAIAELIIEDSVDVVVVS